MYVAFVYDHKYIKNDRDFYGDAIVTFYPVESKEKVLQINIYILNLLTANIYYLLKVCLPNWSTNWNN